MFGSGGCPVWLLLQSWRMHGFWWFVMGRPEHWRGWLIIGPSGGVGADWFFSSTDFLAFWMLARLKGGPHSYVLLGFTVLYSPSPTTLCQGWSVWPVRCGRTDGVTCEVRLEKTLQLQSWSFSLSLLDHLLLGRPAVPLWTAWWRG